MSFLAVLCVSSGGFMIISTITTVSGEAVVRAQIASILCKIAGKDVPIFPGAETPLLVTQKQLVAQQATALPNWPHETGVS